MRRHVILGDERIDLLAEHRVVRRSTPWPAAGRRASCRWRVDRNADSRLSNPLRPVLIWARAASSPLAIAAEYATSRSMWSAQSCSKLCAGGRSEERTDGAGQVGGVAVDGVRGGLEVGGVGGTGPQRADDQLDVLAEQLGQRRAQPPGRGARSPSPASGGSSAVASALPPLERVRVALPVGGVGLLVVLGRVLRRPGRGGGSMWSVTPASACCRVSRPCEWPAKKSASLPSIWVTCDLGLAPSRSRRRRRARGRS